MLGTLTRLPVQTERKVGTTSNHHGPYVLGYTRATMVGTEGSYAQSVGDATNGAVTHPGAFKEKKVYADI